MDKKLLLAMQYQCNFAGLAVPWTEIGAIMGEGITGGAVIQHLAKLRIRMVNQGLSVPPPLRRGGAGSRISTSASSAPKAKPTPTKNGNAQTASNTTKHNSVKSKKSGKKAAPGSDESEEEDDSWNNDESDAEYGEPHAKRAKPNVKGRKSRNIKIEEDSDEEVTTPSNAPKRKHDNSKSTPGGDVEDDSHNGLVAAGAPWLTLEDDYVGHPKTGNKTPYKKKSFIVSLRTNPHKNDAIFKDEDTDDEESEEEVIDGGVESFVDESHILSNEEMNQEFSNSPYNQNFEGLAAAQLEPASDPNDDNGMYNNSYHAGSQAMPFNGGLYSNRQTFVNDFDNQYNNLSAFQASDSIFQNDGLVQSQAMAGVDNDDGGNFDMGQLDDQGTGLFGELGGHGVANTDFFQNNGLLNGIGQRHDFSYQTGIGHNASFNAAGGLPHLNGNNHIQSVPYPIQTSWPSNHSASNETSVNQTPAGTSAGADAGTGYFGNEDYSLGSFNNANIDYSANDGLDMFDVGNIDGNFVGGGLYGNDF